MSLDLNSVQTLSEEVAREVGERISSARITGPESVTVKGRDDLVTEIDLWSEQRILSAVSERFPEHTIIGEETQSQLVEERGKSLEEISKEGICWIVDPLDGTANFVSGIPHSGVAIGVLVDGERVFGLVYDPNRDEMFIARKGEGATLNGSPIQVREQTALLDSVILTGFSANRYKNWQIYREVSDALIDNCHKCRIYGAAALEICWVAAARADVFFQYSLRCWDLAAATLIAEEAGARVDCIRQPEASYSLFADSALVAHPKLFDSVCSLVTEADARGRELPSDR